MLIIEKILDGARSCLNCGSLFTIYNSRFCRGCLKTVVTSRTSAGLHEIDLGGFSVFSLFEWNSYDLELSRLIGNLKGAHGRLAWSFYSQIFLQQKTEGPDVDDFYIINAPGKVKNKKDHSFYWAECLSIRCGAHFVDCLRYSGIVASQKTQNRTHRAGIEFVSLENFSSQRDSEKWFIFADDVVTTGFTAKAAYKALGCPRNFEVWALAYRPLT